MGVGIVKRLVEKGWKVAIADITANDKLADELGDASSYHKCNVADYDRSVHEPNTLQLTLILGKPGGDVPTGMGSIWKD